jgi:hypothetical protein
MLDPDPDEMNADPQPWFMERKKNTVKRDVILKNYGFTIKRPKFGNPPLTSTPFFLTIFSQG